MDGGDTFLYLITPMKLYKTKENIFIENEGKFYEFKGLDFDFVINRKNLYHSLLRDLEPLDSMALHPGSLHLQPPLGTQPIWAAGVTYEKSKAARKQESGKSGNSGFYEKVYDAKRPELFYKASPYMVSGTDEIIYIRRDSQWSVPEPEFTVFINARGDISGFTIGNDVSSRDIEGENPLYLPQAKSYMRAAALGPCLLITEDTLDPNTGISLTIRRKKDIIYRGETYLNRMKRSFEELRDFLFAEMEFPTGVFLMTGTGIVPPDDIRLNPGDDVTIEVDSIGKLSNTISYNIHKNASETHTAQRFGG